LLFLYKDLTEVSFTFLGGARKVIAERCSISKFSFSCSQVVFRNCNIQNIGHCPPFRTFEFVGSNIADVELSSVTILEEAVFKSTCPRNLHSLRGLKSLKLCCGNSVSDVSCLKNIPKLEFVSCPYITDISSLANVQELSFSYCDNISDVSSLGRVLNLKLISCMNIQDVSALGNVCELHLINCDHIGDISALKNVRELHLSNYLRTDVSGLEKVEKLFLTGNPGVVNISRLQNIQVLDGWPDAKLPQLHGLDKLSDLRVCGNFKTLSSFESSVLERLSKFTSTNMNFSSISETISLYKLHELELFSAVGSSRLLTNPTLSQLRSLTLSSYQEDFSFLAELPSLGYLMIKNCNQLEPLHISGTNAKFPIYSVNISNCTILGEIETTRKISEMKISDCGQLRRLDAQHQIGFENKILPEFGRKW
jgi:hypothetical protein